MNTTDIIVVGPAGSLSDEIVVAACRAGGRGYLHFALDDDTAVFSERCKSASARAHASIGVYLDEDQVMPWGDRVERLPDCVRSLIVSARACSTAWDLVTRLRERGLQVYAECRSAHEFSLLQPDFIDGVILKGNESGGIVSGTTAFVLSQQWRAWCEREVACEHLECYVRGGVGPHSAAAVAVSGAQGVVLDSQLLLAPSHDYPTM